MVHGRPEMGYEIDTRAREAVEGSYDCLERMRTLGYRWDDDAEMWVR